MTQTHRPPHRAGALVLAVAASWAALGGTAWAQPAADLELAGVRYPRNSTVAGQALVLNGAGIRFKAVFKVYTAGLYLPATAAGTDAVLAQPGAKRVHVVMLRAIDANELGRLFTKGMQENAPREEFAKSLPGTIRMGAIFAAKKRLAEGESFTVDWVPGSGTVVSVNGQTVGAPVPEPEFYNALLRIWLGGSPADHLLKDALLGKPAPRTGPGEN